MVEWERTPSLSPWEHLGRVTHNRLPGVHTVYVEPYGDLRTGIVRICTFGGLQRGQHNTWWPFWSIFSDTMKCEKGIPVAPATPRVFFWDPGGGY